MCRPRRVPGARLDRLRLRRHQRDGHIARRTRLRRSAGMPRPSAGRAGRARRRRQPALRASRCRSARTTAQRFRPDLFESPAGRQPMSGVDDQRITPVFLDDAVDAFRLLLESALPGIVQSRRPRPRPVPVCAGIAARLGLNADLVEPTRSRRSRRRGRRGGPQHSWLDVATSRTCLAATSCDPWTPSWTVGWTRSRRRPRGRDRATHYGTQCAMGRMERDWRGHWRVWSWRCWRAEASGGGTRDGARAGRGAARPSPR